MPFRWAFRIIALRSIAIKTTIAIFLAMKDCDFGTVGRLIQIEQQTDER
jgi:hypothetical protein